MLQMPGPGRTQKEIAMQMVFQAADADERVKALLEDETRYANEQAQLILDDDNSDNEDDVGNGDVGDAAVDNGPQQQVIKSSGQL